MDPKSMEKAMLKNMVKKTGKTIEEWVGIVNEQNFIVKPYIRFKGKTGEQATMFIKDPNDNILEFKSFKNDTSIFKK